MKKSNKRKPINKTLPSRWRFKHGAYYYRPHPDMRHRWDDKTEFRLGKTLAEAYREWIDHVDHLDDVQRIDDLVLKYRQMVMPLKALKTQESNSASAKRFCAVFGRIKPDNLRTTDVFMFRDQVAINNGKKTANHDLEFISHLFAKAIEWGVVENHPTKSKVPKLKIKPRDRYVEDWEVAEALTVANTVIFSFIWFLLMTGQRRGDILSLTLADLENVNGIRIKPGKTASSSSRKILIPWSDELLAWKEYVLNSRGVSQSPLLFVTSRGEPYIKENGTANAFDSLWQRFMAKALRETKLVDRFQQRDLRPKTASDTDLQHASRLLVHTTEDITKSVYRRKGDTVDHVSMAHIFDGLNKPAK